MLLAIVMVFGMLPMQALADEVLLEESAAETLIEETEALVVETEAPAEEGEAPEEETEAPEEETEAPAEEGEAPEEETEPPTEEPLLEEPELLLLEEAADTLLEAKTETVSIVAQCDGSLLMAPQIDVAVSSDLAESYGYTDSVTDGVSGLDVLVKAHEAMFGADFTKEDASAYLFVSNNFVSTMFGIEDGNICFMIDGRQPNDGKGTGYAIPQAPVKSGDTVEFAFYQDTTRWSDNYVWLELEDGTKLDGQSVSAGATVNVVVKGYSPFTYGYLTEAELQKHIVPISGAKLALVDRESGALTDLNVTTDESGKASVTVPRAYANSTRVLTAYGDYMMMSLAEVSVGDAIAETVLTGLEIAVGGGTMDDTTEQTLTPAFSGDTMSYSTPILDYVEDSNSRFVWVKATAPEGATLTAKCGSSDVATLTSGEWTKLQEAGGYWWDPTYSGCLKTGTYNKVEITLSAEGQDDMVYTVTVPMQPDTANQSLTWKTNLKSAVYYTTNAEGASLSVEAQHQNRPLDNEDVITYQWYRNSTASTEGSTAIAGAAAAVYAPSTAVAGTTYYYAVATCGELDPITSNVIAVTVTEEAAPTSVTLVCDYPYTVPDTWVKALGGVDYVATIGDELTIRAVDENGKDTPVAWSVSAYGGDFNQDTGKYTIKTTSYTYLTAVSLYDSSITSGEKAICVKDYTIPSIRRNQSVALSTDGQTQKTAFVNGGVEGHTIWVNTIPKGVADCTTDLTQKGSSVYFNLLRPGIINVSYALDLGGEDDPVLGDSTTLTVTGVAVEDAKGNQGKTYLELTGENKAPTAQLTAYLMEGRTVASWSSADEAVATVDENGLVTGHAIGSTIITVTDSEGTTGGIKVVVTDADKPTFESIAFTVGNMWSNGIKSQIAFKPETTAYTGLELTRYQASSLDLTANTLYNTEKLTAVATYTDSNGEAATVDVNSGVATKLPNIPFGTSTVTITLTDKLDAEKKTDYTFEVTRPRDTTQQIYNNTGIVVKNAEGGALSADQYQEKAEGYLFRANSDGTIKNAYTVDYRELYYRAYLLDARPSFTMLTKGNSAYVHMRYSVDEGATWKVLPQGGGSSDVITFPERTNEGNPVVKIILQVVSDKTFVDGGNAFPETVTTSNGTTYTIWVEQLPSADAVKMLTATVDTGDWYPAFDPDVTNYKISVANGSAAPVLTYTIAAGTKATIGEEIQTPNEDGSYTLALTTSAQTVTITSADGSIRRQYSFAYFERIANGADKVVDYLCVNSQYSNSGGYGMYPEYTLGSNSLKSLGNFGGYITYYFADGLTDNPANQYGVDFYINGNAFEDTSTGTGLGSMEPGQVWVSEDGSAWYALAGSEHYDADTLWDYTVTYSKNGTGTSWSDNYGNSDKTVGRSFSWPLAENYPLNALAKQDSFALTGILIPSVKGITGNDDFSSYSSGARFGYVDVLVNGTANPYAENDSYQNASSGFDLAWAVDGEGNPVDVSGKSFHYVKVVTASNIIAGTANEKSTEVANITRASAQDAAVGVTAAPTSITFSEGDTTYELPLMQGQQVYEVALAMRNVSIAVNGSEGDNIYINNQRVASGTAATGFTVDFAGETLVRVIVQNGDQEPVIYLLKLTAKMGAEYAPEITKQPASAGYIVGETMAELSVEAVVQAQDGALSYQWFKNTENSTEGGTAIPNAVNAAYAPGKASEAGTYYYYCVVTSTAGEGSLSTASEVAEITVITAQDAAGKVLSGSGTEADPWQIQDAQDYQDVYDLVARGVSFSGQYLKQMKDITLPEGWESIGVRIDPGISHINRGQNMAAFSGTLDGNGRTVTVPEGGHPLFGYVKGAYVQNLNIYGKQIAGYGLVDHLEGVGLSGNAVTIDNVTLKSGSSTLKSGLIGTYITNNGFAGCSGGFTVTIRNCTIEEGVVVGYDGSQSQIGSIAGRMSGTIENCVSYATVYGQDYVGGILGTRDNAMATCKVINSRFEGTVEASGTHAGGILGGGYDNDSAPNGGKADVINCVVSGSIVGADKVGGIVGGDSFVAQLWSNMEHTLTGNTFTGTVTATEGDYVGGIIGYYKSLNRYDNISANTYSAGCGADKGIGFVKYLDTSYANPTKMDGTIVFNTANGTSDCPAVEGCAWRADHNRTDDPLGADADKLCRVVGGSTEPICYELTASGTYKTEYTVGDELDLTGIVLTASWSNGTTTNVALSDVTMEGYDQNKVGIQTITLKYGDAVAYITVTVKPESVKITVSVSILGDEKHGAVDEPHGLARGGLTAWAEDTSVEADTTETVLDVLQRVAKSKDIELDAYYSEQYGTYYIRGVNGLSEKDNGENSGWMYTVNGTHPEKGVAAWYVKNGDTIILHYTDDYTYEEDGENYGKEPPVTPKPDKTNATELLSGKSTTLKVLGKNGKVLGKNDITWTLKDPQDSIYATISATGTVKAKTVLTKHDVTFVGTLKGSYEGTVEQVVTILPKVTQVEIMKDGDNVTGKTLSLNAVEGETLTLTAKVYPDELAQEVTWESSNTKIAKIDAEGTVSFAGKTGTVTVTATSTDGSRISATVKLQVGVLTKSVTIAEPADHTLRSGKGLTLKATTDPVKPTVSGVTFKLVNASDSAYVSVSTSGKVSAKTVNEPHDVKIQAVSKDAAKVKSNVITLTILPKVDQSLILKVEDRYVTKTTLARNLGDTVSLAAYTLDLSGEVPAEETAEVTWKSSDGKVASVDENGTVTCLKSGSATITALMGKAKATVTIKVTGLVKGITVTTKKAADSLTVASGKTLALKANVEPANASNKAVTWSMVSGSSYAKISGSGVVSAHKGLTSPKTVTVKAVAKDGSGMEATQEITINPVALGVTISDVNHERTTGTLVWNMTEADNIQFSANVYPVNALQAVTWKSSNAKIAAVDGTGKVTCYKAGTVTITATAKDGSGKKASFKLKIIKKLKSLTLEDQTVEGGKSLQLKAILDPVDPTNKKLTWTVSSNNVGAKISSSGKLTTKKVTKDTKVMVTVSSNDGTGLTATCFVTITPSVKK